MAATDEPRPKSYAFWNNKGGVGKTTLCFNIASAFALRNPHKKVLVIDMCPQSNVSMLLLGGGRNGGADRVEELATEQRERPRTVVGYIMEALVAGRQQGVQNVLDYLVHPNHYEVGVNGQNLERGNEHIAENLLLLCGDPNLELIAPALSESANPSVDVNRNFPAWKWIHELLRAFISRLPAEWVVFLDTNPSFNTYTALAITAADELLVPISADDSSRMATRALLELIYGSDPVHPIWGQYTYAAKSGQHQVHRPKIRMVISNVTTYYNVDAASAYSAQATGSFEMIHQYETCHPERFCNDRNHRTRYVRRFNTAGVACLHHGIPVINYSNKTLNLPVFNRQVKSNRAETRKPWESLLPIVELLEKDFPAQN